jgi:hypothetical protein
MENMYIFVPSMMKYSHIIILVGCDKAVEYPKLQLRLDIQKLENVPASHWKIWLSPAQIARVVQWSPVDLSELSFFVEPYYNGDILFHLYKSKLHTIFDVH